MKITSREQLYNILSVRNIIKTPENLRLVSTEDDFQNPFYQKKFKFGFWGQLFSTDITLSLLGEFGNEESEILIKVETIDHQRKGIINSKLKTIVPMLYCAIELIDIGNSIIFCCHRLIENGIVFDFYLESGVLLISDVSAFEKTQIEEITFQPQDKNTHLTELFYSLQKTGNHVNQILFKKEFLKNEAIIAKIKSILSNDDDLASVECDVCWHPEDRGKYSLIDSLKYCYFRDMENGAKHEICVELLIPTYLLVDPKLNEFRERFGKDHSLFNLFFNDEAFEA